MFFLNTDELIQYVDLNASFEFDIIAPKLREVDRDILKLHFGNAFIDELQNLYDGANGDISALSAPIQAAIKKLRAISAPAAVSLHVVSGQVQVDSAGIFVAKNPNRGIAWEWQIKDLIKSYLKPAYQAIEDAIVFFKSNIADYATYGNSDEFDYSVNPLIQTSKEFTKFYTPLNNSYMNFLKMRSCMDKVEETELKSVLLPDYYAILKSRNKLNTLNDDDKAIMPFIKKAIANLTAAKALSELNATFDENGFMVFDNTSGVKFGASKKTADSTVVKMAQESLYESGKQYLKELKEFMQANIANYATYSNDSKYLPNQSVTITNTTGSGFYNAH